MSPTTQVSPISSVKVSFNNELRRFPFPIDVSQDQFSVLHRTIAKSFGIDRSSFVVQYVDDENDTVTIGSQLELSAALGVIRQPVLRLFVVVRQQPPTPTPTLVPSTPIVVDDINSATPTQGHTYQHPNAHHHHHHGGLRAFGRGARCGWKVTPQHDDSSSSISPSSISPSISPMIHHGRGGRGGHRRMVGEQLQQQYREQLAELEREGLNCGFWAVRVLANVNGDVEAAKAFIRSRKDAMSDLKSKYASQLAELERVGVLEAGSSSVSLSPPRRHCSSSSDTPKSAVVGQHKQHGCLRKCVRLLEKFNGDVSQVVSHFERKRVERETLPSRYASQLAELKAQGYWCEPVCLRLLNKFDGDTNKVIECMNKFKTRHQATNNSSSSNSINNDESSTEFESKIESLVNKGYARPKCVRLLNKFGGNQQQVEQVLEARKQWFSEVKRDSTIGCRRQALKEAKQRYATEINQLKEMGFKCKWLIVPLLVKHNGDVASVSLALSNNNNTQ